VTSPKAARRRACLMISKGCCRSAR
jgi:hypothetical protein